jgi:hypothetical protein
MMRFNCARNVSSDDAAAFKHFNGDYDDELREKLISTLLLPFRLPVWLIFCSGGNLVFPH